MDVDRGLYFARDNVFMTKKQAKNILENVFRFMFNDVSARYGFRAELQYGNYRTRYNLSAMAGRVKRKDAVSNRIEIARLNIAMPDCFPDEKLNTWPGCDEPVDAYDFVGTLVAMFHEREHIDQLTMEYKKDDPLCRVMAIDALATQLNPYYDGKNYFKSPMEIGAQYSAVSRTYQVLRNIEGVTPEAAEEYILYYQQRRQESLSKDFVPRPNNDNGKYKSVDDLFDKFKTAFVDGVHRRWKYSISDVSHVPDDAACRLRLNFGMMTKFVAEPDGFEQEKMLASLYFEHMAQRFKDGDKIRDIVLGNLRDELGLDLSIKFTFGEAAIRRVTRSGPERNTMREETLAALGELSRQSGVGDGIGLVGGVVMAIDEPDP